MELNSDPRWRRFNDSNRPCPCCGKEFNGVFDIAFDHPGPWPHGNRRDSGKETLKVGDDWLGTDLCRWENFRFIRCILEFPIIGTDQRFAFGPWGSVNTPNFDRYTISDSDPSAPLFEGCFAWMTNDLPGFEIPDALPCNLIPGDHGLRPKLEVHDGAHEIAELQEAGITFDRLLDIYAAAGQDIRPHLMDA